MQPSPFFTEQLTAFEVWLDHGSEHKKPPEQLPIVLQVWKFIWPLLVLVVTQLFWDMGGIVEKILLLECCFSLEYGCLDGVKTFLICWIQLLGGYILLLISMQGFTIKTSFQLNVLVRYNDLIVVFFVVDVTFFDKELWKSCSV